MKPNIRTILAVSSALLGSACADAPSSPASAPSLEVVSPAVKATTLTRDVPLAQDITVSAVFSPNGGSFAIPEAGLKIAVPPGAVGKRTRLTVTAVAGSQVAYTFEPHGLVFKIPLDFKQDLKGTSWYKLSNLDLIEGGYFADRSQLDASNGMALISEFLPAMIDVGMSQVKFNIWHFSGYVVATGRKATME